MGKEVLKAAFMAALENFVLAGEPDESTWTYPDYEAETSFRVFCMGIEYANSVKAAA